MSSMHPSYPDLELQTERIVLEPESEREFPELGLDFEIPLFYRKRSFLTMDGVYR